MQAQNKHHQDSLADTKHDTLARIHQQLVSLSCYSQADPARTQYQALQYGLRLDGPRANSNIHSYLAFDLQSDGSRLWL